MEEAFATARIAVLVAAVVLASVSDLRRRIIPNGLSLAALVVLPLTALGEGIASTGDEWWRPLVQSLEGGALLGLASFLLHVLSRGALGMGDVKLAGVIGLGLGPAAGIVAFVAAILIGALHGLVLLALGRAGPRDHLPFGPSLAAGAIVAAVWGTAILGWWLG